MTPKTAIFAGVAPRAMFGAGTGPALLRGPQVTFAPEDGGGAAAPAAAPEPAPAAEPASLSIEQATAALMGAPKYEVLDEGDDDAPPAPDQDPADGDQPAADGADNADPAEGQDGDDKGEGDQKEPVAALEAPAYWSKEAKARFAELNPEMQAVVLAQEGPREEITAKVKADAKAAIEQATASQKGVQQLAEQLSTALPEWIATFQQKWGEPDWEATARQYGAEQAFALKARYDRELGQLRQAQQATTKAQTEAMQAYVVNEFKALTTLDPELAPDVSDPAKGADKRQEVTKYLLDAGVDRNALQHISAVEMAMARKAMLWDRAQAAAKQKPAPAPAQAGKPASRPAARGGAAAPGSPAQRSSASVQNSFNAKPSIENAVALMMARSGQR